MTIDQIVIEHSAFDNSAVMKLVDWVKTEGIYEVTTTETKVIITGGNLNELMASFREIAPPLVDPSLAELIDDYSIRSDTE